MNAAVALAASWKRFSGILTYTASFFFSVNMKNNKHKGLFLCITTPFSFQFHHLIIISPSPGAQREHYPFCWSGLVMWYLSCKPSSEGVRQGSPASPLTFGAAVISYALDQRRQNERPSPLPPRSTCSATCSFKQGALMLFRLPHCLRLYAPASTKPPTALWLVKINKGGKIEYFFPA